MSMAEELAYMRMALEEAESAAREDEVPVGAVLVKDGKILARAHNRVERTGDPTAHAEMLALREGARKLGTWRLSGCALYVTLEPCAMCAGAAVSARLSRLVFGAHEEKTGCCGSVLDLTDAMFLHAVECCGGVLEEESRAILAKYFAQKR